MPELRLIVIKLNPESQNLLKLVLIVLLQSPLFVEVSARTNAEPCNIGFIFSLPWDVSNTLRAPLGGPLSIVLTSIFAIILFIGFAAAPFSYLFGWPFRKYHLHNVGRGRNMENYFERALSVFDLDQGDIIGVLQGNTSAFQNQRTIDSEDQISSAIKYPDFMESIFFFVPEIDIGCKKLMVCHAHGFLPALPDKFLKIYRFFSKKLAHIPDDFKEAISGGIADQGSCMKDYGSQCPKDIVSILKLTVFDLIPSDIRDLWNLRM